MKAQIRIAVFADIMKSERAPLIGAFLMFGLFTSQAAEPAGRREGFPSLGARSASWRSPWRTRRLRGPSCSSRLGTCRPRWTPSRLS